MNLLAEWLPVSFEKPEWLWLLVLIPVLIAASLRSLAGLDPVRRVLALILRSVLIILVAACLAGVERVQRNQDLTVFFLMDRSHSVQKLQEEQEAYIRAVTKDIPADDRVGVIDFARNAFLEQMPLKGGYLIKPGRLPPMPDTDRTDVASAIRLSMAMFPHDTAKRIVLLSDGNENLGDVLTEARRAQTDGTPIDVVPLWYRHPNEVYIERMIAPTHVNKGEQVPIRMVIHSQKRASGRFSVYQNGRLVPMREEDARIDLQPGRNTLYTKLTVNETGAQRYRAVFEPDDERMDAVTINNQADAFSFVSGAGEVLLITTDPAYDAPLADALRSENVRVDMQSVDDLGEFDLLSMQNYASIILANVPAASFTDAQHQQLASYVKTGSGLIMLGGDEGFGAGGWIGSPIEKVLPVSFEIKHKRVIPRGALVLIMHSCEVPRGNDHGKEMAKKSVDTISSRDYLGVLAYTYSPGGNNWEVPLDLNTNKAANKAKIDRMQIGDMPDFASTMQMAHKELTVGKGRDAAQRHVIILSDGDASPPSAALLKKYKDDKITVSTIGIGWGGHVMKGTMQDIARKTGGRYYDARNPRALPQIFMKESKVVRRPLIIEEPFQPQIDLPDSPLLAGIETDRLLPGLGGMVLTSAKADPNAQVAVVRVEEGKERDPVLAYWQHELGKSVVFTSGYWPKWGGDWTRWERFAKFWAQIIRWTMRQEAPANFDVHTKFEGNQGRIVIDALDKDASFLNFLQMRSTLVGADNEITPLTFTQTGPGHYEATFQADKAGHYLANIHVLQQGQSMGTISTGLTVPFSPEYQELGTNEALLRQVVTITGGRWFDMDVPAEKHDVFSHDLPATVSKRPAWEWMLAWLLLPLFLLDVATRRLASWLALSIAVEIVVLVVLLWGCGFVYGGLWGIVGAIALAELIGWTIRFRYIGPLFDYVTHGVVALGQAGQRSAASLEQLKTTRDKVREDFDEQTTEALKRIKGDDSDTMSPETRRRKFDAGGEGEGTGDLSGALGGAASTEAYTPKKRPPAGDGDESGGEAETAASRLLRHKRKMRKDTDDGVGNA